MSTDLRTFVASDLRLHPRVAYQNVVRPEDAARIAAALPPLTPFREDYAGALCVVDWDHRLPSQGLIMRIWAYYTGASLDAGEEAFDDRLATLRPCRL